ncbi:MAG: UDP-N-acetylmuramoyl-tripeptide--D-alanyl-D-alanine ligase [Candidatus Dormibacteria bacterium]
MLRADTLADLLGGRLEAPPGARLDIPDLASDSRLVVPGGGFIALPGEEMDGHAFVADAARRGAALAVVGEGFGAGPGAPPLLIRVADPAAALRAAGSRRLAELGATVVGVTGSVGKTTAKEMCALALSGRPTARTLGNLNTWTQIPLQILKLEPPVERLVVEMGMTAPGEIADLAGFTHPRVGLLLNVGQAHIGRLGSEEAIADAKAELLDALPADGVAILNADDPRVVRLEGRSRAPVRWFGEASPAAAWRIQDVEAGGVLEIRATLVAPDGRARLRLRAPGRHLLLDAVAAVAVAAALGVGIVEAAGRLGEFAPAEHRGRILPGRAGSTLIDDSYNSSPSSLAAALTVLRESGAPERLAIIGDMLELGDRTVAAHREAGRRAAAAATRLIAVGGQAGIVAGSAVAAGMPRAAVQQAEDAERAADLAVPHLGPETVVLVKASRGIGLDEAVERLLA